MKIKTIHAAHKKIAEVISDRVIISGAESALDLLGNIYYQGFDCVIIHKNHVTPDFFDLKSGIAGEILQKFSTYRIGLAIIGDFEKYESKSLKDFIFESNRQGHISFVPSIEEALEKLSVTK